MGGFITRNLGGRPTEPRGENEGHKLKTGAGKKKEDQLEGAQSKI